MNSNDFQNLTEAYNQVHQLDEVLDTPEKANEYAKKNVKSMVGAFVKGAVNKDISQLKTIEKRKRGAELGKRKAERKSAEEKNEEFETWVNELMEEGYDLSDYTWEEMHEFYLDEAEGSYGETPKAYSAASKTKMTAKRKPFLKKMLRRTNPAERKSETSPRKGMTASDREEARAGDAHGSPRGHDYPSQGPGGVTKNPKKLRKQKAMGEFAKEELDVFDVVLEFLQVEGYAETLEEAEWMMANELDEETIDAILEAEGSYGKTPKARAAMGKLAIARREKPASEYSQKGEKTKKVKSIEKHTQRIDNGPDVGNRGKKSTKPRWSGMLGKSGRGKLDQDSRDYARDSAVEYTSGGHKPGSGTVTKNPKKLRKQKAMGEIGESFDTYEFVLCHLLDEGYASTEEAADKIILNMSEAWFEDIMELNRVEKETGINTKTGRPTAKGGAKDDKAYTSVKRMMRKMEGTPAGQRKKEPGKKPPKAGEYGGPRSPEQKVAKLRADKKRSADMMSSRFD
jgi:hypothetical protein